MQKVNDEIFRSYDIRGIYPKDIDPALSKVVARSLAKFLGGKRLAVSMDVRTSNEALTKPFIDGLIESGCEVWFIGVAPTPLLYFTIAHYGLDGGAAVSASHNPAEWNGFKLCGKDAKVLGWGEGLEKIKEIIKKGEFSNVGGGRLVDKHAEVFRDYEKFIFKNCKMTKRLHIALDPGNGACCGFAADIMRNAKQDVTAINDNPDGRFPSRNPEPKPDTIGELRELVKGKKLDFGVAFDGDGDRAVFVDDTGNVLGGDLVLTLFVDNVVKKGDRVVYEVSCSDAVKEVVEKRGGVPIMTRVGHGPIESKMVEVDAKLGGEISGHMYFRESYYFDDAFFAAAKMVELLSARGVKLSELVAGMPQYKSRLVEFEAADNLKFKIMDRLVESLSKKGKTITIDGVKLITDNGWIIIRASNTGPKIKMVCEARDAKRLEELIKIGKAEFESAYSSVKKA